MNQKEANAKLKLMVSQADEKTAERVSHFRKRAEPVTDPHAKKLINELIHYFELYSNLLKESAEAVRKGSELCQLHVSKIERLEATEYN